MEFTFTDYSGFGKNHSTLRKKNLLHSLHKLLLNNFKKQYVHYEEKYSSLKEKSFLDAIKKNKWTWPDDIDLKQFKLSQSLKEEIVKSDNYYNDPRNYNIVVDMKHGGCDFSDCDGAISMNDLGGATNLLKYITSLPFYKDQLCHVEVFPSKIAIFDELQTHNDFSKLLVERVRRLYNIEKFYIHQVKGIEGIRNGRNVAVSTSTSSGKSIIYNFPICEAILSNKEITALYIFPTKVIYL